MRRLYVNGRLTASVHRTLSRDRLAGTIILPTLGIVRWSSAGIADVSHLIGEKGVEGGYQRCPDPRGDKCDNPSIYR